MEIAKESPNASPVCVCQILPPHIQAALIERGDADQRLRALEALQIDATFRTARVGRDSLAIPRRQGRRLARAPLWLKQSAVEPTKDRTIYTAQHRQRLPGSVVRVEGEEAIGNAAVDEAYDAFGDTLDFYWDAYGRDSIDGQGLPLQGTTHFGVNYDNAFWDGQRMVFGDGDGKEFNQFTISVDVIGHELTHGVTQQEAGLLYWAQSGALNESLSDVFGSLVKQYVNKQTADEADWLIGQGLLTNPREALRSMKAPGTAYDDDVLGKDPQPANMEDYDRTFLDNRGVHINSGIPNRAFYLTATAFGGYAWESAGLIWYHTLLNPLLRPSAQFSDFGRLTVAIAGRLFSAAESGVVRDAWNTVGVTV